MAGVLLMLILGIGIGAGMVAGIVMFSPGTAQAAYSTAGDFGISVPQPILPDQDSVTITVVFKDPPVIPIIETNAGKIEQVFRVTDFIYEAVWYPPKDGLARVAVIAAWDDNMIVPEFMVERIILHGSTIVNVEAPEGAAVTVDVGGMIYGPEVAAFPGLASFKVDLSPGIHAAKANIVEADGKTTDKEIELDSQSTPLVALFLVPNQVNGDGYEYVRIHAFASTPEGEPTNPDGIVVNAANTFYRAVREGNGYYVGDYPVARYLTPQELTISATIDEEPPGATTLYVDGVPAADFRVEADPAEMIADGSTTTTVTAWLSDGEGTMPLSGYQVKFSAEGGSFTDTYEVEKGKYQTTFTSPTTIPMMGSVTVKAYVEGAKGKGNQEATFDVKLYPGEAHHAAVKANPSTLPPDGQSYSFVTVAIQDVYNNHVPMELEVKVDEGTMSDLSVIQPGEVTFKYTAPSYPDLKGQKQVGVTVTMKADGSEIQTAGRITLYKEPAVVAVAPVKEKQQKKQQQKKPLQASTVTGMLGGSALWKSSDTGVGAAGPWLRFEYTSYLSDHVSYTLSPGMMFFSSSSTARSSDFADGAAGVETSVTSFLMPIMGGLRYSLPLGDRLSIGVGMELGVIMASTSIKAESVMNEAVSGFQVVPALAIPVGLDMDLGPGLFTVGLNHLLGLSSLGEEGETGVNGQLSATGLLVGYKLEM